MSFTKIAPTAGLVTDGTRYSAQGTWYDSDKVRFRKGFAEKIGGWVKYVLATYLGTARRLHDWVTDSGDKYVGVGTNLKLYVVLVIATTILHLPVLHSRLARIRSPLSAVLLLLPSKQLLITRQLQVIM